jgi:endoglucanase
MRRLFIFLILAWSVLETRGAPAVFHRGVNLTNWFQAEGPRRIQFTKYTKKDFQNIRSLGCDVIRLPVNLHAMTNGAPDYTVDPLFLSFLDSSMDWAEELGMVLIVDNHTFDPSTNTDPAVENVLAPVWKQVAAHCKNRSALICYEVLNEPHGITDEVWNAIQQKTVAAIRGVDTARTIVVGGSGWNGYNNLASMPVYKDAGLVYTFHFYDPFLFTHQGASWATPSLIPLAGVPFPHDPLRMPACPPELKGTWVEGSLASGYRTDGTVQRLREAIGTAAAFKAQRGVPVYCGELGVYIPNSPDADRVGWYGVVRGLLEEKGIPWTIWDYQGGFGLFKQGTSELFDSDLNIPLVQALGLNAPAQTPFSIKPDSAGFTLYGDYVGQGMFETGWISEGTVDFYSESAPVSGKYCIDWTGAAQYNSIAFQFKPVRDLSALVRNGAALDFWVKGDTPASKFDIRFIDTKTAAADDHPWRMRVTIDDKAAAWNNGWNHVSIPLSAFAEHGSWDNAWFNPQGKFDWKAVERFEIAAEQQDLHGVRLWFDEIKLTGPGSGVADGSTLQPVRIGLDQNSPNPFNPSTWIHYRLAGFTDVRIAVYDAAGRLVRTLVDHEQAPGAHSVAWDGRDEYGKSSPSGLYIYILKAPGFRQSRKMVLMR